MRQNDRRPDADRERAFVLASLFLTGGAALVLEIAGARLISPFYGSSIYTWSSLITVTLAALAAGYNLGGRLADRGASLLLFSRLLSAAAATVALVPWLRAPALKAMSPLGVQLGALASATALVAPALVLLGALGPLAIRLNTSSLSAVGRSAGDVYALSTLGSVFGALLTGFVLVPHLGLAKIFYGIACLLLLLSALGHWLSTRRLPLGRAAAAAGLALYGFWPRVAPQTNILHHRESAYGQIKVLEFNNRRYLLVNGTTQSMAMADTLESDSQYAQSMEWAVLARPEARRALVVGLGAGLLPRALERGRLTVDSVEIDPEMAAVAARFFGFAPKGRLFVEDGRAVIERSRLSYDLIFLDAFGSETPPYHLFTRESFEAARRALKPGGALAVNLVSLVEGPGQEAWLATHRTLRAVFPEVKAYLASDAHNALGNVLFFCSERALADGPEAKAALARARPEARANIEKMLSRELTPSRKRLEDAVLMTDERAPMEFLLARTSLRWRESLQSRIAGVLIY